MNEIVREVAGENAADAHASSTAKVHRKIIADCLSGEGRTKVENWIPRYMEFPAQGYTDRFAPVVAVPQEEDIDEAVTSTDDDGEAIAVEDASDIADAA